MGHTVVLGFDNENASDFYKKLGMKHSENVMELSNVDWTEFTVQ